MKKILLFILSFIIIFAQESNDTIPYPHNNHKDNCSHCHNENTTNYKNNFINESCIKCHNDNLFSKASILMNELYELIK